MLLRQPIVRVLLLRQREMNLSQQVRLQPFRHSAVPDQFPRLLVQAVTGAEYAAL